MVESAPRQDGRNMTMVLHPLAKGGGSKKPKQPKQGGSSAPKTKTESKTEAKTESSEPAPAAAAPAPVAEPAPPAEPVAATAEDTGGA
jgi:translation initiation factor IF-3